MMPYNFDEIIPRGNTNSVKYDARKFVFGKADVLPLWVADMDFRTPDFVVEAVKERAAHEIYGYPIKPDSYFEAIQDWLRTRHGWQVEKEWIQFSPGVVSGLATGLMAVTRPGDKVIVQTPVYFPFFEVVEGLGRQMTINELAFDGERYTMDFEQLAAQIDKDTRAIMLCSPHNPVGRAWTKQELQKLAGLAEAHGLYIISDDIHADLLLHGNKHYPLATFSEDMAARTITAMAPSKTFNMAGLAASVVVIPDPETRKQYAHYLQALHLGMGNIFGLAGLEAAYRHGHQWLDELLVYLEENLAWMNRYFTAHIPQVNVIQPEATYLAWLDFRALGLDDKGLQRFLAEKAHVGLNNGARFGQGGEGFMRINFACPRATLQEGVERIARAVKEGGF